MKSSYIKEYVCDAIEIENAGLKVDVKKNSEYPTELTYIFDADPDFKMAFQKLTPGRQHGYILHFCSAKQSKTRIKRIERSRDKIIDGKDFFDR